MYPDVERAEAERMAQVAKALADPIRLQLVDVLRKHAGRVCVCELVPLFEQSQPTISHHLKVLRRAGIVDSERHGLWAYYYVVPDALSKLSAWLREGAVCCDPAAQADCCVAATAGDGVGQRQA